MDPTGGLPPKHSVARFPARCRDLRRNRRRGVVQTRRRNGSRNLRWGGRPIPFPPFPPSLPLLTYSLSLSLFIFPFPSFPLSLEVAPTKPGMESSRLSSTSRTARGQKVVVSASKVLALALVLNIPYSNTFLHYTSYGVTGSAVRSHSRVRGRARAENEFGAL